jgi:thioester reductase-like protein
MKDSKKNVFVTGGTGFVGKAVLARLIDNPAYNRVYLLIRGKAGKSAKDRLNQLINGMFPPGRIEYVKSKIVAIDGDLTLDNLGINDLQKQVLIKDVHQILHVGASTDFGAPIAESRRYNVEGTRLVLNLAEDLKAQGMLTRFDYVSTAYVAGRMKGVVTENDLERGQLFSNNYEQSKYEAELLVRQYCNRLDIAIYRPSIVVGDSNSGYTPHFKVLYWPLMLLSRNLLPFFTCNQGAQLDVVPVDYVADGIVALMSRGFSIGQTYHLTAGLGNEVKIKGLLKDSYELASVVKKPILPFWLFNLIKKSPLRDMYSESFWDAVEMASPYHHYLRGTGTRFDNRATNKQLADLGVVSPRWHLYKKEVLKYCLTSKWGKRVPLPEYVYYLPVSNRKEGQSVYDTGVIAFA